jgi:hypothetical protein
MKVRDKLFRLAGYDPEVLTQHKPEDHQPITHLGWMVLVGAVVAGVNWAVGGYVFAEAGGPSAAIGAAAIAGLVGICFVVVIDRTALYSMDTHEARSWTKWFLVFYRAALTCAVSSITTQAVAPILFKPAFQQTSVERGEETDRNRHQELNTLQSAVTSAEAMVRDARQAMQVVPPDILHHFDAAKACWAEYNRGRDGFLDQGATEYEARSWMASKASVCARAVAKVRDLLEDYGERARITLSAAEAKLRDVKRNLIEASSTVAKETENAANVERTTTTPVLSTVLNNLLAADAGAPAKFWTIFGLIIGLELMPLVTKLIAPQTVPGSRIATDRLVATMVHLRRRNAAMEEQRVEGELRSLMASAMIEALSKPDTRCFAAQLFATKVNALVPVEVFKTLMHEIEAREIDVQALIRRYPACAKLVTEAWRKSIEESVEILQCTRVDSPAFRVPPAVADECGSGESRLDGAGK